MNEFFFSKDQTLRPIFINILFTLSMALMVIPWFINIGKTVSYVLFCIGSILGAVAAYSDRFGNKSFTKDPLGWRKAKKSYETQEDSDKAPKKGDPS